MAGYHRRPPRLEDLTDFDELTPSESEADLDLALMVLASSQTRPYSPTELITGLACVNPTDPELPAELLLEALGFKTTESQPAAPPLPVAGGVMP